MSKYEELGKIAKEALEEVTSKGSKAAAKKAAPDVSALKRRLKEIDSYWYAQDMSSPTQTYARNKPEAQDAWIKVKNWQSPDRPMDFDEFVDMWNDDVRERKRLMRQIKKATGGDWETGY